MPRRTSSWPATPRRSTPWSRGRDAPAVDVRWFPLGPAHALARARPGSRGGRPGCVARPTASRWSCGRRGGRAVYHADEWTYAALVPLSHPVLGGSLRALVPRPSWPGSPAPWRNAYGIAADAEPRPSFRERRPRTGEARSSAGRVSARASATSSRSAGGSSLGRRAEAGGGTCCSSRGACSSGRGRSGSRATWWRADGAGTEARARMRARWPRGRRTCWSSWPASGPSRPLFERAFRAQGAMIEARSAKVVVKAPPAPLTGPDGAASLNRIRHFDEPFGNDCAGPPQPRTPPGRISMRHRSWSRATVLAVSAATIAAAALLGGLRQEGSPHRRVQGPVPHPRRREPSRGLGACTVGGSFSSPSATRRRSTRRSPTKCPRPTS